MGLPISELTKKLEEFQPDRIFIGNTFTFLWRAVYEIVAECKRVMPKVPVKVGGLYAILCPEGVVLIHPDTSIQLELTKQNEVKSNKVTYEDIGGLGNQDCPLKNR